ncbi:MAG: discoidin domain-containing protein, partial [Phycisphaerales bacterium]
MMCKKLTFLTSFVFVLGLVLTNGANADDTSLVGYWKLDDGVGTSVADSSGRGHTGHFAEGSPAWVEGKFGKALQFNGQNKVEIPDHPDFHLEYAISMALWIKPEAAVQPSYAKPFIKQRSGEYPYGIQYAGNGTSIRATVNASARVDTSSTPNFPGEWGHLCMTYDGSAVILYKDGEELVRAAASGKLQQNNLSLSIGGRLESSQNFVGIIDDVRLYNIALTPAQISKVMEGPPLGPASKPIPSAGAEDVPRDVVLSWTPGELAPATNGHRVYLSESFRDVNDGVGGVTQSAASYAPAQRLDFETTYYWRVDEVNAPPDSTVFRGDIWTFTTEPVGYPIDGANITATASSSGQADLGPENTINGSGLDENDLHSTKAEDMWLSGNELLGAWIQYEFDTVHSLHEMWVWNSNQAFEALFGFGVKDVIVEYSTNGTEWTALAGVPQFAKASGMAGYAHDTTVDFGGVAAKYVKLTANSNWGGVLPQYSLSEVRFFYIPVNAREPSPGSGAADVDVDGTLSWRAGREAGTHDVYLSANQQAVIDGTVPAVTVPDASYSSPLDLASTYYWRIDEVNDTETPTTWQGDVWDFTTEESIVVEDFEDYNDYPP